MKKITPPRTYKEAIIAHCIDCSHDDHPKRCCCIDCYLYPFRLGKNPFDKRTPTENQQKNFFKKKDIENA